MSETSEYYERANGTKISKKCTLKGVENIEIGAKSFVSDHAVLDASQGTIRMGDRTYIGPHVRIIVSGGDRPQCIIGDGVWIGDGAQLNSCWIGHSVRIGMNARVDMDVVVQERAHVEHKAWLTEGTTVPNNTYYSDHQVVDSD
eukprot:gb/GECG01014758.1/.p1 GENE.gb/GECG01014758.1/~~gb/GECG01014758.1/.p1  ORF type:complete len:144 (+),score=14.10 gb/GECG01014758.1/:1-432(+)